jgi:hypothetical protein
VKPHEYAEAMRLVRCVKMNSIFTIVTVCGLSVGTLLLSLWAEQPAIVRLANAVTLVLMSATR